MGQTAGCAATMQHIAAVRSIKPGIRHLQPLLITDQEESP